MADTCSTRNVPKARNKVEFVDKLERSIPHARRLDDVIDTNQSPVKSSPGHGHTDGELRSRTVRSI